MSTHPMPAQRRAVYESIVSAVMLTGQVPTVKQLAAKHERTAVTIYEHIKRLIESGHLARAGSGQMYVLADDRTPSVPLQAVISAIDGADPSESGGVILTRLKQAVLSLPVRTA